MHLFERVHLILERSLITTVLWSPSVRTNAWHGTAQWRSVHIPCVGPTRIHALLPRFGTRPAPSSFFNERFQLINHDPGMAPCRSNRTPRLQSSSVCLSLTQIELRSRHCSSPASSRLLCPLSCLLCASHSSQESGIVQVSRLFDPIPKWTGSDQPPN